MPYLPDYVTLSNALGFTPQHVPGQRTEDALIWRKQQKPSLHFVVILLTKEKEVVVVRYDYIPAEDDDFFADDPTQTFGTPYCWRLVDRADFYSRLTDLGCTR